MLKVTSIGKIAQNQPQGAGENQPQGTVDASKWTFKRLMQDQNFRETFQTIKNQRENERRILEYWKSMGIPYDKIPEILDVIG